jgi:hypothetical protein
MANTEECKNCKKRFKKLTEEGLCYYCYYDIYHKPPKEWMPTGKYTRQEK